MTFNPSLYHYHSRRNVVYAQKGMVASSSPLASQAGLEMLKKGGNAVDAAVAVAACLTVVEPTSNGIGGDAFCLVWSNGRLYGLNASGPAPLGISAELLREKGFTQMPTHGFEPVTVPGTPSAWAALAERFGKLPFGELLKPAINCAENGFPLPVNAANGWAAAYKRYKANLTDDMFKGWFDTFVPNGVCPGPGDMWRSSDMAKTLQEIADTRAESFYRGNLAENISAFSKQHNGYISVDDLAGYHPEWVEPIKIDYRGYDVYEIPPNGQGITALIALNILKGFDFGQERENLETYHRQIEAIKLAFADAAAYVADPHFMKTQVKDLLNDDYAGERRKLIGETALTPAQGKPPSGGTVYFAAADNQGNMVSYIQSNYQGFGSGLVVPGTGISLHNRGCNFTLEDGHPNCLAPGKKPYHTIIPGFLAKGAEPVGPFGVMGGFMQPQGHVQVITNTIDFHMNPQDALDAPRWQWMGDKKVAVEADVPMHIIQGLADAGHEIKILHNYTSMGRGQIIWRLANGVLCGGTEPRTDGSIAVC